MGKKLEVIFGDLSNNPWCRHGPTLLFARTLDSGRRELFYACSACRNKEDCNFYMKNEQWTDQLKSKIADQKWRLDDFAEAGKLRSELLKKGKLSYCHTCNTIFNEGEQVEHDTHDIVQNLSSKQISTPTSFLRPLNNDKREAQYFFSKQCLEYLLKCFIALKISKVICIGTPTVHEHLKNNIDTTKIESILLDFDHRFCFFLPKDEFFGYNMFNNHFFQGEDVKFRFESFMNVKKDESALLIVDPPFGCRTEPLVQTLKCIKHSYQQVNSFNDILPIFWVFPYYMENYVQKYMPEMEMADYKVDYTNHDSYTSNEGGRKFGSPVRIFTNIPLNALPIPDDKNYMLCKKCDRWKAAENKHCNLCKDCPSKNGQTYRHCNLCSKCVKPNYKHCMACGRCVQTEGHNCSEYQQNLTCWICRKVGHNEDDCESWRKNVDKKLINKKMNVMERERRLCVICRKIGHNELQCTKRKDFLKETSFLGCIENVFNKCS